jgi:hypothetical protein
VAGCWGVKPLKITMPDDMLQMDEDGVAYYAHHAGASTRVLMRYQVFLNNITLATIKGLRVESYVSLKKRPLFRHLRKVFPT